MESVPLFGLGIVGVPRERNLAGSGRRGKRRLPPRWLVDGPLAVSPRPNLFDAGHCAYPAWPPFCCKDGSADGINWGSASGVEG